MPIAKGQGQSDMTPFKQQDLAAFINKLWLGRAISASKKDYLAKTIQFIDMYAGSGWNPQHGLDGSPIILCKAAENKKVPYFLHAIEEIKESALELEQRLNAYNARVYPGDNRKFLPEILNRLHKNIGLLYADPNGIPDWEAIARFSQDKRARFVDILIRYNSSAHWRNLHNGYLLPESLNDVDKKFWYGKEVYHFDKKQRWSFLWGCNYEFGDWESQGWIAFSKPNGKDLLEKLTYGPTQRQKKSQFPLTGLIESTCNIPNLELSERKSSRGLKAFVKGAISARLRKFIT